MISRLSSAVAQSSVGNFLCKGSSRYFGFVAMWSLSHTFNSAIKVENPGLYVNEHGHMPIKFYLEKQAVGHICPTKCHGFHTLDPGANGTVILYRNTVTLL